MAEMIPTGKFEKKKCPKCKSKKVFQIYKDKSISGGKLALGYFTGGTSLFLTGVRKGKVYVCSGCGHIKD